MREEAGKLRGDPEPELSAWDYQMLVQHLPIATFIESLDHGTGHLTFLSPQIETLTGYPPQEFTSNAGFWKQIIHPDDLARFVAEVERTDLTGEPFSIEYRCIRRDGRIIWVRNEAVLVTGDGARGRFWQGYVIDITPQKELEARLAHEARHDPVTELPNRLYFDHILKQALEATAASATLIAALYLDLDNFKYINDSLGHHAGDELLVSVADRLQRAVRCDDTVARLGGDEFAVLLRHVQQPDDAVGAAERLLALLNEPLTIAGREVLVGGSVGVVLSDGSEGATDLLRWADIAMYRAKSLGKNQVVLFDPSMDIASERLDAEQQLRFAIEHEDFSVHYQPIVSLQTGQIIGLEALARWQHQFRGIVPPSEFIPLAEESGLIAPLNGIVLRQACRDVERWNRTNRASDPLRMSVNLSGHQLREGRLVDEVREALDAAGLDPACLILEIAESVVIDDGGETLETLERLVEIGVQLAVDDFGFGQSSLAQLRRFPVHHIKIDRQFMSGLGSDLHDTVIVSGVNAVAHGLNLTVIAEGIETAEQVIQLYELGCELGQGYFFSEPLPAAEITSLLDAPDWGTAITQSIITWLRDQAPGPAPALQISPSNKPLSAA